MRRVGRGAITNKYYKENKTAVKLYHLYYPSHRNAFNLESQFATSNVKLAIYIIPNFLTVSSAIMPLSIKTRALPLLSHHEHGYFCVLVDYPKGNTAKQCCLQSSSTMRPHDDEVCL